MRSRNLISPEGLRNDGRRPGEIRRINCEMGVLAYADGSAYLEQGNSKIICAVYGPRQVISKKLSRDDKAVINCEYSAAGFSTIRRIKKEKKTRCVINLIVKFNISKVIDEFTSREIEISNFIKQTFEEVMITGHFPKTQIDIFINAIQIDGGIHSTAINATTLAVINAGIPIKDFAVSCTAGYYEKTPIVDINRNEDVCGLASLPVVIFPKSESIVSVNMEGKLVLQNFEQTLNCAINGCYKIHRILEDYVRKHSLNLLDIRGV